MNPRDAVKLSYPFVVAADLEAGGWVIKFPDLSGCMTQADTFEEVGIMAQDAFETWMDAMAELGRDVPPPSDYPLPSWDWTDRDQDQEILTTSQVASILGVTARRVRQLADSRQVGQKTTNGLLFHRSDLEHLRVRRPGRPARHAVAE
ncbi:MAG TPA: type II toxin-antitoxin system HicB family antitoxin [Thermomicrobiales bacterium]|nr:type II toxin-antitoxin system HicB family antitoxin [Thermomicrobiales bacterium]